MPGEVFGPLAPDECAALAVELVVLQPALPAPGGVSAISRLEGLTRASVHLLRLERELRRVASEDEIPALDEALAGLRVVFRALVADEATGVADSACELAGDPT
jgi:hypothetical protein